MLLEPSCGFLCFSTCRFSRSVPGQVSGGDPGGRLAGVLLAQHCRSGTRAAKSGPREAKAPREQPRAAQGRPKSGQGHPKSGQERHKSGQERPSGQLLSPPRAPKSSQDCPQRGQERTKSGQERPKTGQERLKAAKRNRRAAPQAQFRALFSAAFHSQLVVLWFLEEFRGTLRLHKACWAQKARQENAPWTFWYSWNRLVLLYVFLDVALPVPC